MKKKLKFLRNTALVALTLLITLSLGTALSARMTVKAAESYESLKIFSEILSIVQKNYVEDAETKDLIYGAVKGMLSSLDPHSSFMPPEAFTEMQVETKGKFGGVGIEITMKDVLRFSVVGEDDDTYEVSIERDMDNIGNLQASCSCNNAQVGDLCLHRFWLGQSNLII